MSNINSIYVSHSSNQKLDEIFNGISKSILDNGYSVCSAKGNISAEFKWLTDDSTASTQIENSFLIIFFITEKHIESTKCQSEVSLAKTKKKKRIYLVFENIIVYEKIRNFLESDKEAIAVPVYKLRIENEKVVPKICHLLYPVIKRIFNKTINNEITEDNYSTIPLERNKDFISRDIIFNNIDETIKKHKFLILKGLLSAGKKSCALEYCYRISQKFIWFNSCNREALIETIIKYTKNELKDNKINEFPVIHENFLKFIQNNASNLILVFINVRDENEYENILKLVDFKSLQVATILTTKCTGFDNLESILITPFKPDECDRYLRSCLPIEVKEKIDSIYSYLKEQNIEVLPFKLAQIKHILANENSMSPQEFSLILETTTDDYLFYTIFENLSLKSRDAMMLLRFIRFLNPSFINGKILKNIPIKDHFLYIVDTLSKQNLCRILNNNSPRFGISVHRVLQNKVEAYLDIKKIGKNDEKVKQIVINTLNKIFPKIDFNPNDSWFEAENIYSHLITFLENVGFDKPNDELVELYDKVCMYSIYKQFNCDIYFDYAIKSIQLQQILLNRKFSDSINMNISDSLYELGSNYLRNKNYEKSDDFLNKALNITQEFLSDNRREHLKILDALAEVNLALNREHKCIEYDLEGIKISRLLNKDNSKSLSRLSVCYKKQKEYNRALHFCLKALRIRRTNSESVPSIAQSLSDAASLYKSLGNAKRSFKYLIKSYKLKKKINEVDSCELAQTSYQIGLHYSNLNQHENALKYKEEALDNWRKLESIKGEDIFLAKILNSIAVSKNSLGEYDFRYDKIKNNFF